MLQALAANKALRIWVSYADDIPANRERAARLTEILGLELRQSPVRWAPLVACRPDDVLDIDTNRSPAFASPPSRISIIKKGSFALAYPLSQQLVEGGKHIHPRFSTPHPPWLPGGCEHLTFVSRGKGFGGCLKEGEPHILSYLLLHNVVQQERVAGFVVSDDVH
jgi:hypothetical protein